MSVRAESCRPSIPVRERPAYGDSDRAAGRDGSERSRRLGRREPRLAHSGSPLTISRDGSCHTDLRARGFLRAACLGFLVQATRRRRENAVRLSKLGHQVDFHGRQRLRNGALRLGGLSNLLEGGGVDAGNLALGFERNAGDRETSRYRRWPLYGCWSARAPAATTPPEAGVASV